ncbi:surface polysaccharide O-acyltransferase-like enzyme [Shimia isoporae]|uniref:Surface polysaccharide O-acyltransferase-like enzyme n=1 Tax=Shimia isoporae TaxID=647720 RepID=A0A4R1N4Z8_9RHOB|nr:acyltransferase [Shimia isoporae]TCL01140.1 surface polysaccharide O-acyltransferase-like enzyme [Shimia isoporae]
MSSFATTSERHIWIDALRLFAGLSMVGLHATADAAGQPYPDAAPSDRIAPLLLRSIFYVARTELFLMISILLLLMSLHRVPRTYRQVIKFQVGRLLAPFLFWTVFYAPYGLMKAGQFGYGSAEIDRISDLGVWAKFLLLGDVKYHMHFIPTLLGLIVFFPLYRMSEKQPLWGLAVVPCLLLKHLLEGAIYSQFWHSDALPYLIRILKVTTYIGYGMAAGAVLGIWNMSARGLPKSLFFFVLACGVFLFAFKLISTAKVIQSGTWEYTYVPGYWADLLMPVVLLIGAMCLADKLWPEWISRAAKYSFGIYLCHPIFLDLAEIALQTVEASPMLQVIFELAWVVPTTALFVFCISRIPVLAWTIGLGPLPQILPQRTIQTHLKQEK